MKLNEDRKKITLTIKQLKRLIRESKGVTTKCYGKEKKWPSRQAAIDYFTEGMYSCDEGSSEWERYFNIVSQLENGADYAADDHDSGGGYPLYEIPRSTRRRRRSIRESFGDYDLSGVKKGDILYSSGGYNMILVSFYKVAQIIGRTVLLQPLKNKIVSGDHMSGKCVPDEDRPDGGYVRRRLSNGRLKGKYDSELLKMWDGQPKMFDHWD